MELVFQDEGHLYANCLFFILTVYRIYLLFQFFLHLWYTYTHSHPSRGSKGRISGWKNCHILLKNVLLRLNFQDEGHFYAICLFYILSFCLKCLPFQFLSCGMRMHILVLTGVQNGYINSWKNCHIWLIMACFEL